MFRNTILVRATSSTTSSSSSSSPFFLIHLALSSPSSSSLSIEIETLCWKLSRQWRLSCLFRSPDILIVYQKPQFDTVARVVEEFAKALPSITVGAEEEVESASLIAKAVECGLSEERTHVGAVNVQVQSEINDAFVFLVSPDVLRFNRHKIADLVGSKMMGRLNNDEEAILEEFNFLTSCTILPSLHEGHVTGLSKVLPYCENINKLEELWSYKHGLELHSNYFVAVQLAYGGCTNKEWFPSSFVLQGSGLSPAPQTTRVLKAVSTFESFMKLLGDWDFFSSGILTIKEISSLANGAGLPNWKKVTSTYCIRRNSSAPDSQDLTHTNFIHNDLLLALDFRTPKPALGYSFGDKASTLSKVPESAVSLREVNEENTKEFISSISEIDSTFAFKLLTVKLGPVTESIISDIGVEQTTLPTFTKNEMKDMQKSVKSPIYANSGSADGDIFIREKHFTGNSTYSQIQVFRGRETSAVKRRYVKEEMPEGSMKISKKQHVEEELAAKVIAHHKEGKLQTLTVADLKCFLTSKKAKVRGKKEDLLSRVSALLA